MRGRLGVLVAALLLSSLPALAQAPVAVKGIDSSTGATTDVGDASNNALRVNVVAGGSAGTTDTDDGSVAAGQSTSIPMSLSYIYNGSVWARLTFGQATMAASIPVTIASNQTAIPVSGTFWQATQPVSNAGTFAVQAAQSGTWTVQPGNTANSTAWLVTGTGGTFPVTGTVTTTPPANASTNVAQFAGTTTDTNSGNKSAGTLRVVLATDQPALTNKLLVTPDSVALPANQSVNVSQINGVTPLMGNGVTGTGSQRVTIASDNTAFSVNANAGTNLNTSALALDATVTGRLPAGASPADNESNTNTNLSRVGSYLFVFDGSTWDRWTGTINGTVNVGNTVSVNQNSSPWITSETAPTAVSQGQKTVAVTNTAVALASTSAIKSVTVKALAANGATVYIGGSGVTTANGFPLNVNDTVTLAIADIATVYVNGTSGDGVAFVTVN